MGSSICKVNIKCMELDNKCTVQVKYRDEICLNDQQRNIVTFNIRLKIVALKAFWLWKVIMLIKEGLRKAIRISSTLVFGRLCTICVSVKGRSMKQSLACRSFLVVMVITSVLKQEKI